MPAGPTPSAELAVAIIPARLGSTRFPGKVLAARTGRPLIAHVWEAARGARSVERVVIATDDARVADAVRAFGGEVVMSSPSHPNGTSRLAEAARALALAPDRVVVNVQGDEPELNPALIDLGVESLRTTDADAATVASPFAPGQSAADPNIVKVVLDARGRALYFSRAPIPFTRNASASPVASPLKHLGLYVYTRAFLDEYVAMPPTPLERAESLEQLRILEHGRSIAVAVAEAHHVGIDTPEQYEAFVARVRGAGRA